MGALLNGIGSIILIARKRNELGKSMRLTQHQIEVLKSTADEIFGSESHLVLFGSRVDDSLSGGDIDLYVIGFNRSVEQRLAAKLRFLVQVQENKSVPFFSVPFFSVEAGFEYREIG